MLQCQIFSQYISIEHHFFLVNKFFVHGFSQFLIIILLYQILSHMLLSHFPI